MENKELKYQIVKATLDDIDEIATLYDNLNTYLEENINYPGWKKGVYPTQKDAINALNNDTLFICKTDDRIAGTVILNNIQEEAYNKATWSIDVPLDKVLVIHTLAVHPDFFKMGVAYYLLVFAKEYAANAGYKTIRLDVNANNLPAFTLYEKMGYKYIDTVDLGLPYKNTKWFKLYDILL